MNQSWQLARVTHSTRNSLKDDPFSLESRGLLVWMACLGFEIGYPSPKLSRRAANRLIVPIKPLPLKKNASRTTSGSPSFAMICCQNGAQSAVLAEVARDGWRLAFSRPGFVTVKQESQAKHLPRGVFVRSASWSLGKTSGTDSTAMIAEIVRILNEAKTSFDRLHVWPRDRVPIGRFGFEPGVDEVSRVIAQAIAAGLPRSQVTSPTPNQIAKAGDRVLDIVIVDPSEWWIGWHEVPKAVGNLQSSHWLPTTWPGAVQPITPTVPVISRAYYKAAEAIAWSGLDIKPDDLAVEVGSAPGGACGRLLELGLRVIGIDPGEMDPAIADHPRFKHIRARAGDIPRREFRNAKWLFVDSNVRPDQSLTTVENIINHRESSIEGMILTLKLGGFEHADRIAGWIQRIKTWGALDIRIRNLARGKVEVCMVVQGSQSSSSTSKPGNSSR